MSTANADSPEQPPTPPAASEPPARQPPAHEPPCQCGYCLAAMSRQQGPTPPALTDAQLDELAGCYFDEIHALRRRDTPQAPGGSDDAPRPSDEGEPALTVAVAGILDEMKAARLHGQQKYGGDDPIGHDLRHSLREWLGFVRDHLERARGDDGFVSLEQREHLVKAGGLLLSAIWSTDVNTGRIPAFKRTIGDQPASDAGDAGGDGSRQRQPQDAGWAEAYRKWYRSQYPHGLGNAAIEKAYLAGFVAGGAPGPQPPAEATGRKA